MKKARTRLVVAAAAVLLAGSAGAMWQSGALLTNFVSATFSLPSGSAGGGVKAGVDPMNVPNLFTRWICVTDQPQLCMSAGKNVEPPTQTAAEVGNMVCFTVSFSNCGNYSAFGVTITDVMPVNTMHTGVSALWVAGHYQSFGCIGWATSMAGPWYCAGEPVAGQVGPLYLRWVLARVGMHKSGYVRYCVTIL